MTNAAVKKVDGTSTRMLRRVKNVFRRNRLSNAQLYGQILKLSTIIKLRRLALDGYVARDNEPAITYDVSYKKLTIIVSKNNFINETIFL